MWRLGLLIERVGDAARLLARQGNELLKDFSRVAGRFGLDGDAGQNMVHRLLSVDSVAWCRDATLWAVKLT